MFLSWQGSLEETGLEKVKKKCRGKKGKEIVGRSARVTPNKGRGNQDRGSDLRKKGEERLKRGGNRPLWKYEGILVSQTNRKRWRKTVGGLHSWAEGVKREKRQEGRAAACDALEYWEERGTCRRAMSQIWLKREGLNI